MEENLNFLFFVNGRRLQPLGKMKDGLNLVGQMEDNYNFYAKWKTTSICWQNKR
jgi:hypothetical protein